MADEASETNAMIVRFITGNASKLAEVRRILPDVESLEIDLAEVQSLDVRAVVGHKLDEARKSVPGEAIVVEDVSFEIATLNGFPGPLIKWLLEAVGADGIARVALRLGDPRATARAVVALDLPNGTRRWFEGVVHGRVTEPRGSRAFGWDPIFQPDGHGRTYGEMTAEEKNQTSHRAVAWRALAEFVEGLPK